VKLVIAVDGAVHERQRERDQARTEHLEAYGYHVLRFTNQDVLNERDGVIERILGAVADLPAALRVRQKRTSTPEVTNPTAP